MLAASASASASAFDLCITCTVPCEHNQNFSYLHLVKKEPPTVDLAALKEKLILELIKANQ